MTENIPVLNIVMLISAGLFCTLVPVGMMVFYKLKHKESKLICALAGALTFVVWVLFLEPLMHMVMLPLVQDSVVLYVIYGCLAAGVFEETGRFITYKLFLRKTTAEGDPQNAVMFGIGHGGIESVIIIGVNMISFAAIAMLINAGQADMIFGELDEATKQIAVGQIETFTLAEPIWYILNCFERMAAVLLHISLSVVVFEAAHNKKRVWLYPAAILAHALFDVPAALYQKGVLQLWMCEIWLFVNVAIISVIVYRLYKGMKKEQRS